MRNLVKSMLVCLVGILPMSVFANGDFQVACGWGEEDRSAIASSFEFSGGYYVHRRTKSEIELIVNNNCTLSHYNGIIVRDGSYANSNLAGGTKRNAVVKTMLTKDKHFKNSIDYIFEMTHSVNDTTRKSLLQYLSNNGMQAENDQLVVITNYIDKVYPKYRLNLTSSERELINGMISKYANPDKKYLRRAFSDALIGNRQIAFDAIVAKMNITNRNTFINYIQPEFEKHYDLSSSMWTSIPYSIYNKKSDSSGEDNVKVTLTMLDNKFGGVFSADANSSYGAIFCMESDAHPEPVHLTAAKLGLDNLLAFYLSYRNDNCASLDPDYILESMAKSGKVEGLTYSGYEFELSGVIGLLIKEGGNINKLRNGKSLVEIAIENKNWGMVKDLAERGATKTYPSEYNNFGSFICQQDFRKKVLDIIDYIGYDCYR